VQRYQPFILYQDFFGEMNKFLKIIFCKLYQWFRYLNTDDLPHYTAISIMSVLITFNVIAIASYTRYLLGYSVELNFSRLYILILFLAIMGWCYLYFIKDKRYADICRQFNASKHNGVTGNVITAIYISGSILLLISLIWLS
jgi:hypothetical protein